MFEYLKQELTYIKAINKLQELVAVTLPGFDSSFKFSVIDVEDYGDSLELQIAEGNAIRITAYDSYDYDRHTDDYQVANHETWKCMYITIKK